MCYNDPPFESIGNKGMGCIDCAHPTCANSADALTLTRCPGDCDGMLILDIINGAPNWKFFCSSCSYKLQFSDITKKVAIITGKECDSCESQLTEVILKDGRKIEGCVFCNESLKQLLVDPPKHTKRHHRPRRRGRRPLRSR
uniref:DNA topoisomerase, putative n=2 Tax=Babesia bovis TaxID=5865 RepID=S6BGQ6_BABBO|nr:DNA topoisomerase, putative [Babesia bovis]